MNIKVEVWNGHEIRFVEREPGDWWAVANDVAYALEYANARDAIANHCEGVAKSDTLETSGGKQIFNIINELDIYSLIFGAANQGKSEAVRQKAKEFKQWVYMVIKTLRQATGLEGFQVFRMLDKEHQREAMAKLHENLAKPAKVDYVKANTIANKAVSTLHGYPKMVKKEAMTPEMLTDRQPILADTVELMTLREKYGVDISVSELVYSRHCGSV